jgi:hypothetical protein
MSTDDELHAYIEELPVIYREILAAFPRLEPNRKRGYGLGFQTLAADFESRKLGFTLGQVIQACQQLQEHRLVKIKHGIFVYPTERGERLIAAITGEEPAQETVPPLPAPPRLG